MFKQFTREGRELLVRAQEHARRLGHCWVGCEHLLLGVADSQTTVGSVLRARGLQPDELDEAIAAVVGVCPKPGSQDDKEALAALGIDLDEVCRAVEASFGPGALEEVARRRRSHRNWHRLRRRAATGTSCTPGPPFTPKAKRGLEIALRESLRLKHDHIGIEHLALALLLRDDTAAWKVILHLGAAPGELRREIEGLHPGTA